jgi:predicted AAA+ superfamily ATPase
MSNATKNIRHLIRRVLFYYNKTMIIRHLRLETLKSFKEYPAIIITGPRQIGKTFLVQNLLKIHNMSYITMDDEMLRKKAIEQPNIFFNLFPTPLFIDEVQKAQQIFNSIKIVIDEKKEKSLFILTGSQKFTLMTGVTESLAGRACILEMQSLSQSEINTFENFLLTSNYSQMEERFAKYKDKKNININERIIIGSMPDIVAKNVSDATRYYKSYVETVLCKDIENDIIKISKKVTFLKFLKVLAIYSGNILNINNIARDIGVDTRTLGL